jgi:NAD(P)-dependent dehydrogenase (short-subunit alcohol dehydrogenase family)
MGLLDGKVALISGSGGGQGRAAALAFAGEGAKIVGCDLVVESSVETTSRVIAAGGEMTSSEPLDLSDPDQAETWVASAVEAYGGIDIVYNNAGKSRRGAIPDLSVEDWRWTLGSELDSVFFVTKFAWPHLVRRGGGVIISTASVAGMLGHDDVEMVAHIAAKGAVIAMTRQFAAEGAPFGIRAVAISPGPIASPGAEQAFKDTPEAWQAVADRTLLKRWGTTDEVAALAVFLASQKAAYLTGVNYVIDGGMTAI